MDKADHEWFKDCARSKCPDLTCLEYETIIDKFENASTRILISFDEAKTLLPTIDESCLKLVHEFWHQRRTMRVFECVNADCFQRMKDKKNYRMRLHCPSSIVLQSLKEDWNGFSVFLKLSFVFVGSRMTLISHCIVFFYCYFLEQTVETPFAD